MSSALVILAAGIGARYGGGIKQLEHVGPAGELIIDYSIHDALAAGFDQIVFIIRRDMEKDFREVIGNRVERLCRRLGVRVDYAFQEMENIPADARIPAGRVKPWGTGHALISCREVLHGPFVIINADDYYGKAAFRSIYAFLQTAKPMTMCMAGFFLGNTLSAYGGVTRGVCQVSADGYLEKVTETRNVISTATGAGAKQKDGRIIPLEMDAVVSMNMWGMGAEVIPAFEAGFRDFFRENRQELDTAEFLIPVFVDKLLRQKAVTVRMLPTADRWFGITYREDTPSVREAFRELVDQGVYGANLFDDL
ncbi:MAG: nucleotidyltransferase [Ruminococcaceae bacterium]|nr:nucleotidyltransferase [Oscillospiraceae bacterium]